MRLGVSAVRAASSPQGVPHTDDMHTGDDQQQHTGQSFQHRLRHGSERDCASNEIEYNAVASWLYSSDFFFLLPRF